MSDRIELRELRCSCVVGVLAEERERPQPVVFDLDLECSFEAADQHDNLALTTDYGAVLALTTRVARDGKFQLLETLAQRVAHEILASAPNVSAVRVAVRKLRPPVPEDVATVGVRCTVRRS